LQLNWAKRVKEAYLSEICEKKRVLGAFKMLLNWWLIEKSTVKYKSTFKVTTNFKYLGMNTHGQKQNYANT
jgi:hypothetical protein